jgi:hypothetical protein
VSDAIIDASKWLELTGSFALHPHYGKIRADVDRRIIQNSPYGRGIGVPKITCLVPAQPA